MSTGDIKNNIRKLQRLLRQVGYKEDVDYEGMTKGLSAVMLPIYHYVITSYSHHMVVKLTEMNMHLTGTTDQRFVDLMYKVLRDVFQYRPCVPKEKFFTSGFAERKVIMCNEVISAIHKLHIENEPMKPNAVSKSMLSSTAKAEPKKPTAAVVSQSVHKSEKYAAKRRSLPFTCTTERVRSVPLLKNMPAQSKGLQRGAEGTVSNLTAEVVGMRDGGHVRPIDTIQTPGRPVSCDNLTGNSSRTALLNTIVVRLDNLSMRLTDVQERLSVLEDTVPSESKPKPDCLQDDLQETVIARITLLESRMTAVNAKVLQHWHMEAARPNNMAAFPAMTSVDQDGLMNTAGAGMNTGMATAADLMMNTNALTTDLGMQEGSITPPDCDMIIDTNEGRTVYGNLNYSDHNGNPANDEADDLPLDPKLPSPIISELIRQVVRVSCSESETSEAVGQEEEALHVSTPKSIGGSASLNEDFNNLSDDRLQQAQRIQNMLDDTAGNLIKN